MFYTIFGLSLYSSDPIPGLVAGQDSSHVDVFVEWVGRPPQPSPFTSSERWFDSPVKRDDGTPLLRAWKLDTGRVRLAFWNGVEFLIGGQTEKVQVSWPASVHAEEAISLFFDDVLALILRWRGITCLHASAVRIGDGAVAFVGTVGMGKSTTAAALGRMGYPLITDDLLPLFRKGAAFYVQPAYARMRLWPESAEALGHDGHSLPRLAPEREKRRLDLLQNGYSFQRRPVALEAAYLLGARSDEDAAPYVETVSPQTGVVELLANKYTRYLLDKEMAAQDFDVLTQLATQIRPRRIVPHADIDRLPQLCERILADVGPVSP